MRSIVLLRPTCPTMGTSWFSTRTLWRSACGTIISCLLSTTLNLIPWGEICIPLGVKSAPFSLKYFVSVELACCASQNLLSSALSTPVDDEVVANKNLGSSTFWPSADCRLCCYSDWCWSLVLWWFWGLLLDSASATILALPSWYTIFGWIDWKNPSRSHLVCDWDKTCWSIRRVNGLWPILAVDPHGQASK